MFTDIRVFKFGGASVKDPDAVRNVASVIAERQGSPLVIVVSAMGKMTNALEDLSNAFYHKSGDVRQHFDAIRDVHWDQATQLLPEGHPVFGELNDLFVEVEWVLEDEPPAEYNYMYDQIVSIGELLSSRILSAFLKESGIRHKWLDARDVIKTDNTFREARINWPATQKGVDAVVKPALEEYNCIVTQGFIGCTSENFTSTLGREGSDYSAAILAFCLDAAEMTIWKDVPGVLTADPRKFINVELIERMTYREAVEMTYYGAKVIHPKTIKPLQNKNIPLYVKSFDEPENDGTWIGTDLDSILPPVVVMEENQALIHIATRDFSFVAEHHLSMIFELFAKERLKINLMRNTAISFTVCCQYDAAKFKRFTEAVQGNFSVVVDRHLALFTIRHSTQSTIDFILKDKIVLLEERFKNTVQYVVKHTPAVSPKE